MRVALFLLVNSLTIAVPQQADAAQPGGRSTSVQMRSLLDCRQLTEAASRLSCYDQAVMSLEQATATGSLVVVDREEVRKARRGLFGFDRLRLPFLGDDDGDDGNTLQADIQAVRALPDGRWQFSLADGSVWHTTEADTRIRTPKAGQKVMIRRGSLGAYFLAVERSREMPAKRIR